MKGRSLRLRLLVGASFAIFVTLVIAWLAMSFLFERHLERRVESELRRDAAVLVSDLSVDATNTPLIGNTPPDPRYAAPTSGLYWQVQSGTHTVRSRSLWDAEMPMMPGVPSDRWRKRTAQGPFNQTLLIVERQISSTESGQIYIVQLASSQAELKNALQEFGIEIASFLFLLWLTLSAAAWLQVHLGLIPLKKVSQQVHEMRRNPANRLGQDHPREVGLLVQAINDLATAREVDLRRARQRAADLAHGMKTPLSVLAAQSRLIRSGDGDPVTAAEGMDRAIAWAAAAVEAELARARAAQSRASRQAGNRTDAQRLCRRLAGVLERTEKGARLEISIEVPPKIFVPVTEADLSEILGPILENAVKFADRVVLVSGGLGDGETWMRIEDDGPGMSDRDSVAALKRGVRLDEAGAGHGLGLAIAREMAEATDGTLGLNRSQLGGLCVHLHWATPDDGRKAN